MWHLEGDNTCSKLKHKKYVGTYTHVKPKPHSSNEIYIIPHKRHKIPKEITPRYVGTSKPPAGWENAYAWILRNRQTPQNSTKTKNSHSKRENYAASTIYQTWIST